MAPATDDDRPPIEAPATGPEFFLTKDRAKRFVFRLTAIRKERSSFYKAAAIGMTSFAEAVPALLAVEEDMAATVDDVLRGRLRDRERGETEIPFVAALEGVLERTRRARMLEQARRSGRIANAWAQERALALLDDAVRRLDAFATVYDAERFVASPASTEVGRILTQVEEDAAIDHLPAVPTERAGPRGPATDGRVPRLVTAADALDDLLRAARAEVSGTQGPWRVEKPTRTAPVVLAIGARAADATGAAPDSLAGPGEAAARTDRAAEVLKFAHGVEVTRTWDDEGEVVGVAVGLVDPTGAAVEKAVAATTAAADVALAAEDEAAMRAYLVARQKAADPSSPGHLVAVMGLFKAVDRALERTLRPVLEGSGAGVVARAVPREDSRKAPVRREIAAALGEAVPGLPVQRATEVLDAVATGKVPSSALRPPDVGILLLVLGRAWGGNRPFGEPLLAPTTWSPDDAVAAAKAAVRLAAVRADLEKQRDPGTGWADAFQGAAVTLLTLLARVRRG
jgi:hypothetical protein